MSNHTISERRLAANRANALKSTGPRSAEGKARSSLNALRHGITGQVSIMTEEDRAAHDKFSQDLIDSLQPRGPLELQFASAIAEDFWRLQRIRALENDILALGSFSSVAGIDVDHPEIHASLTHAQTFLDHSKDFERLTLYEQRINRSLEKNRKQLDELQAKRRSMEHRQAQRRPGRALRAAPSLEKTSLEKTKPFAAGSSPSSIASGASDHAVVSAGRLSSGSGCAAFHSPMADFVDPNRPGPVYSSAEPEPSA